MAFSIQKNVTRLQVPMDQFPRMNILHSFENLNKNLTQQMINYLWTSSRIPALITACKSVSMYSNTKYRSFSFSAFTILINLMIFSCPFSSYKNMTSLKVLCASVALLKASNTLLKALLFLRPRFTLIYAQWPSKLCRKHPCRSSK